MKNFLRLPFTMKKRHNSTLVPRGLVTSADAPGADQNTPNPTHQGTSTSFPAALSMNQFPVELIDLIIDFLHSDMWALLACSLVCRTWLPASRFHLFRTVHVRSANVHSVVELLASPSSTIINHVRTLHIYLHTSVNMEPVFDIIAPYLRAFVAVKTISLRSWRWFPVSEGGLSREFGRIGNMELTRISYDLSLPWFNLTFALCDRGPSTFSSYLQVLCSANYLSYSERWLSVVMSDLVVSEIKLSNFGARQLATVQAMIKSGGETIHTIKLGCMFMLQSDLGLIGDRIDLTHKPNLRSLSIEDLELRDAEGIVGHGFFYNLVKQISSFCLTHIRIGVLVNSCVDLTWLDCKKAAEELNRPRFSELQDVRIDIFCDSDKIDDIAAWVREEMSSLDDRKVLSVTYRS